MKDNNLYRKGINAIIIDKENKFLIVNLNGHKENEYGFVGGGLEQGESNEDALFREINEELGLNKEDFEFIGESKHLLKYNFSKEIIENNKYRGSNYIGQLKAQFLLKFIGNPKDININDEIREFKWIEYSFLFKYLLHPNQLDNAKLVIEEFQMI